MLKLSHKNLEVYKFSMNMIQEVYKIVRTFPKEEIYVLVAQLKRASISVTSNIAEGASRYSKAEKKRFYEISRSSLVEVDTQLEIAVNLKFVTKEELTNLSKLINSTFAMLSKMIDNLKLPSSF